MSRPLFSIFVFDFSFGANMGGDGEGKGEGGGAHMGSSERELAQRAFEEIMRRRREAAEAMALARRQAVERTAKAIHARLANRMTLQGEQL